jgi:hypothetical protein
MVRVRARARVKVRVRVMVWAYPNPSPNQVPVLNGGGLGGALDEFKPPPLGSG